MSELIPHQKDKQVALVKRLIATKTGDVENTLLALAEQNGDEAFLAVLKELAPVELAKVLIDRQGLYSAVAEALSEEQMSEVIEALPRWWQDFEQLLQQKDVRLEDVALEIMEMQEDMVQLLHTILFASDDLHRSQKLLQRISESDNTWHCFLLPFLHHIEVEINSRKVLLESYRITNKEVAALFEDILGADQEIAERILQEVLEMQRGKRSGSLETLIDFVLERKEEAKQEEINSGLHPHYPLDVEDMFEPL